MPAPLLRLYCIIILSCFCRTGYAQLCKGSLGDPIKKIDFGAGTAHYGPALPATNTTYPYTAASPNDGYYTITNNTAGLNTGWFYITDHTGNAGGYMMVVNASVNPQIFYTQQIDDLCPGTTYEFAAWVMNILNYVGDKKPNITFTISTIEGKELGRYDTGNIQESKAPTWVQYGLQFTTPDDASSVIIKMTNNGTGGVGNDVALDDITFRPCGPLLIPSVNGGGTALDLCRGDNTTVQLSAVDEGGYNQPRYQWQVNTGNGWADLNLPGTNSLKVSVPFVNTQSGTYQYRLAAGEAVSFASVNCRVVSGVSTVTVHNYPAAVAANSGPACPGSSVTLSATQGATTYSWKGPNNFTSTQQSPVVSNVTAANAGVYEVTMSNYGCASKASTILTVYPEITPSAGPDVTVCYGSSTILQASGGSSYEWAPAAGLSSTTVANPVASPASTTTYTVTVYQNGCSKQASVKVTVLDQIQADAGANQTIIAGQSAQLQGKVSSGIRYYWTPTTYLNDATSLHPVATPPVDITYTLHAVSDYCSSITSQVSIKVLPSLNIPNSFSPNGDGINDTWTITGLNSYTRFSVRVFNRYGLKVYESIGYPAAWDGRYQSGTLPAGTYYYIIDFNKAHPILSGWLVIIK